MAINCIFWDFDGVILNSMHIRDLGFKHIFKDCEEEQVNELLRYHRLNGGLSRYHKIRYFYEKILQKSITDEEVLRLASSFSAVMRELLTDPVNLIDDAISFIRRSYQHYEFHITSGSDQEELRFLCRELNIAQYFKSIQGSPRIKKDIVRQLMLELPYAPHEICLIGDSVNDEEAAEYNGIAFFGYNNLDLKSDNNNYIDSFVQLKQL